MGDRVKKWGSVALLVTLFSGIAVTGINNYITWAAKQLSAVQPVVVAVDKLTAIMIKNQDIRAQEAKDNANQHAELSVMIYNQNARFSGNEAKLNRVINDCQENYHSIQKCEKVHKGK